MLLLLLLLLVYGINAFQLSAYGGVGKKMLGLEYVRKEVSQPVVPRTFHAKELFAQKKGFSLLENSTVKKLFADLLRQIQSKDSSSNDNEEIAKEKQELIDLIMLQKLKFSRIGAVGEDEFAMFVQYLPDFMAYVTFGKDRWTDFLRDKYYPTKEKAYHGDTDAMALLEDMKSRMKELWDVELSVLVRAYEDVNSGEITV
jgi:hypothetical protein